MTWEEKGSNWIWRTNRVYENEGLEIRFLGHLYTEGGEVGKRATEKEPQEMWKN